MKNSSNTSLKYRDEADRAYGVSGMTIAVVVCNAEDLITGINIDAEDPSDMMELSDNYYMAGNRANSVSAAWQQTLSALRATLIMATGNVMARCLVGQHTPVSAEAREILHEAATADAVATCQLDNDEIDELFSSTYSYLERVFSNRSIVQITDDFAHLIRRQRRLSQSDIMQAMRPLARF
ncbi:MAG: hypothetical protein HDR92_04635 [Bacteroides sp.]|nr:hypothetical protein [Bacteroides sp.]